MEIREQRERENSDEPSHPGAERTVALDPVCGMKVVPGAASPVLIHRGLIYRFCSVQCLERFQATPALYTGARRTEEIQPMPKRRRLRIADCNGNALRQVEQHIRSMKGIKSIVIERDKLTIAYDLRIVTLSQIEGVLAASGLTLRAGLHGWRRALWRFAESNESENAAHTGTGACCSRPPPRMR
ncbi:MAG TPA: hypothetical protein VFW68_09595 [Rhodocyclaceae bacterium]|nr:hypothetical protein [Rhodocyclaceae bacterium]